MIERIDDDLGHYYRDPDNDMLLPGVTMILDQVAPTPDGLRRYQRRIDAEAGIERLMANLRTNGDAFLTVLDSGRDVEPTPQIVAEALALADAERQAVMQKGTDAHAGIAEWLDRADSCESMDPGAGNHRAGALRAIERLELVEWATEVQAIRPGRYGGTADLVGVDRHGRVHVVDWKIRTEADEWLAEAWPREAVQVAAYSGLHLPQGAVAAAHVVRLDAVGGAVLSTVDLVRCWAVWARYEQQWRQTAALEKGWHLSRVQRLGGDR